MSVHNRLSRYFQENTGLSREANWEHNNALEIRAHYFNPLSRRNVADEFYELATQWKAGTKYLSLTRDKSVHPAYQRIIGMGQKVIPLILNDLAVEPRHWFWALTAITGVDPVPPDQEGNIAEMRRLWLEWGKENDYI